jgi:hypothetical protein
MLSTVWLSPKVREPSAITDMRLVIVFQLTSSFAGLLVEPEGYGRESQDRRFQSETIFNDAASGIIWVENQVSLGANETVMGKACFEQWLCDMAFAKVKHYHGDNGIFSAEEYRQECINKGQTQSFSGVGAQHQNA